MFNDTDHPYIEIAAKMLNIDVGVLNKKYPDLVDKLNLINDNIHKVKPYGMLQSTQIIATIIDYYFDLKQIKEENNGK